MAAEGTPPTKPSLLARPFYHATRVVLDYPVATVALALALAAVGILLTVNGLGYRTSRLDLLNPESDYNRLWIEYINEFGDADDAVVVVEGAGREEVVPVLQEISAVLAREDRLFHAVLHEVDLAKIQAKGLHYLSPDDLLGIEQFVQEVEPILQGDWSRMNLGAMASGMTARLAHEQRTGVADRETAIAELTRLSESLQTALTDPRQYRSPWPAMPSSFSTLSELSSEYLLMKDGQLGFVLLRLAADQDEGNFAHGTEPTDRLRSLIAETRARHPEVNIGLTGLPIMENDEMRASQSSMLRASLLSLGGVALLFVAGFGGLRHAMLANVVLLVGMAWAFGYVTLAVGHLNILSVSFAVALIGIGIDFGVHYVARYLQLRGTIRSSRDALLMTSSSISPAITTGAVTTAVSFFAAGMTDFIGIAELGIIAGGGILLCAAAQLFVLPATIYLFDRSPAARPIPSPLPVHRWVAPLLKTPRLLLFSTLLFTGVLSCGMARLWYDHNLLNMQPVGLESVEWERKLLEECNQSVWYALSMADSREELLERKAKFLALPSVERTEEIVSLLPVDHEVKRPIIERIQQRLAHLPERPPLIDVTPPEELGHILAGAQECLARESSGMRRGRPLEVVRDCLRRTPLETCNQMLSIYQQQMAGDMLSRLHALRYMANPEPPQLTDLPASLVDRFVGQHGRHLLKIYGRGNIWDMDALRQFVSEVREVDERVTGNPLQAYEASTEMKQSYEQAAGYALLIILTVLWFDFRSIPYALLAALPLLLGVCQMFGLLGLMNIPLNPANMIALPLILGIGIDYGVHVVHDFREQSGRYQMAPSTAVAVLVDSLTTIVGFGALMIASHQGLQSLGRVLTIGLACCTFTSLVILPALLTCLTLGRPRSVDDTTPERFPRGPQDIHRRRDPAHRLARPHEAESSRHADRPPTVEHDAWRRPS